MLTTLAMTMTLTTAATAKKGGPSGDGPGNKTNAMDCQKGGWQDLVTADADELAVFARAYSTTRNGQEVVIAQIVDTNGNGDTGVFVFTAATDREFYHEENVDEEGRGIGGLSSWRDNRDSNSSTFDYGQTTRSTTYGRVSPSEPAGEGLLFELTSPSDDGFLDVDITLPTTG